MSIDQAENLRVMMRNQSLAEVCEKPALHQMFPSDMQPPVLTIDLDRVAPPTEADEQDAERWDGLS